MSASPVPLCLAFDGTLTPVRTLDERLLQAVKQSPRVLLRLLRSPLRTGPLHRQIAADASIDASALPLRRELLEWLRRERAAGRRLVLLADWDRDSAEQVAGRLNLFDEVATIDAYRGSVAERRRHALIERFGERGFDYVGSDAADRIVWNASRRAFVVGDARAARGVEGSAAIAPPASPDRARGWHAWIKALRVHQWAKNVLIFVPALLAHAVGQPEAALQGVLAFVAFNLCASSVYVVNDLLDLDADRQHPRKRHRPFASGLLSVRSGLAGAALLLAGSIGVATLVGARFLELLAAYYLTTWAYSLHLKRIPLLDVMVLAGLYTLRIIAGAAAMEVPLSFWLLAFSVFMFLSLGFVKRYAELHDARRAGRLLGYARGYGEGDLPLISSLGTASGYSAIVVMALYINSADSASLYQHHKPLWLICPLMLYWISRVWLLATRGTMHDDPLVFALHDRISLLVLAALAAIILLSI